MLHWISLDDLFEGNRVDPSVVNEVLELMGFTERLLDARALKIAKEVVCQYFSRVTHRREETYHPNFPPKIAKNSLFKSPPFVEVSLNSGISIRKL